MRPAEQLEGLHLNGWTVVAVASRKPTATGGNFSTGYLVKHDDGREGFLKAMDYLAAMLVQNTAEALQWMTEAYLFEKRICEACRTAHLRRVVHAIESGSVLPDPNNPFAKVEYLIFERADGDIRAHLDTQTELDSAFALRVLHHVAIGLEQMHGAGMAHQDLKPSNVLVFNEEIGSKIGDLGRAWSGEMPAPHDGLPIAGDPGYAPPEQLYRAAPADAIARRYGCDLYHFGSMIGFVYSQVHMNAYLAKHLAPAHRPNVWGGILCRGSPVPSGGICRCAR